MPLKDRSTQGGPLDPVIIAETDEDVVFITGLTAILTVGDHQGPVAIPPGGLILTKPAMATHIKLQVLLQNVRYTIDNKDATTTHGFQLAAGADTTAPVPNASIRISQEETGASLQYQWIRSR